MDNCFLMGGIYMALLKQYDMCNFINYNSSNDLCLYEVGYQACQKNYSFGPCIRARSIFHYVFSGKGVLTIGNKKYEIHAHQGFLIPANELAFYQADAEDPWTYQWIHIGGDRIKEFFEKAGLNATQPIFAPNEHIDEIEQILKDMIEYIDKEYYMIGKTYELFDYIIRYSQAKNEQPVSKKLLYIKRIINIIQVKYSEPIHVDDIASICGFDRSYLTKLFKEATGQTLQDYLLSYRMKKACKLLIETLHPVQYIAYSVGYCDVFTFSKAFKRYTGYSPSYYKKNHEEITKNMKTPEQFIEVN